MEEQFAASVETSLRVDANLEKMFFKNHIWQHEQLKSKGITSLIRPSIVHFSYRDPSTTAVNIQLYEDQAGFFVAGFGLLHLNLHLHLQHFCPQKNEKDAGERQNVCPN